MTDVLFRFQLHTTEAAKLEAEVTKAQNTITAAQQLISQLDGEHRRWNSQVGPSVGPSLYLSLSLCIGLSLCLCLSLHYS